MKRRVAVRGIIELDGKILLVKLKAYDDALEGDYWCCVGGTVEPQESLLDALHREIIEETGVVPKIGNLLFVQQFADEKMEHLEFFFRVTNAEDFQNIDLSKTVLGEKEIAEIAFVEPSLVNVLPAFLVNIDTSKLASQKTEFYNYI